MVAYTTTTSGDRIAAIGDMMTTVVCVDCGQADSKDRMLKAPRGFVHIFNKYCEKAWQARAEAAERRVAELEARLAESEAHAERNQGSADVLDEIEELMFGWEDDD